MSDPKRDAAAERDVLGALIAMRSARAEPCPTALDLASARERRADAASIDAIERHIARCDACREVYFHIESSLTTAHGGGAWSAFQVRRWRAAAAFVAAASIVAVLFLLLRDRRDEVATKRSTSEAFALLVRDAGTKNAERFGDFRPLDAAELSAYSSATTRASAALAPLLPRGVVLGERPDFRWESTPLADRAILTVMTSAAAPLFSVDLDAAIVRTGRLTYPADQPALEPGRKYLWKIGPPNPDPVMPPPLVAFALPTAKDADALRTDLLELRRMDSGPLGRLLEAHFALRKNAVTEADAAARAAVLGLPDDRLSLSTLLAVLHAEGSRESQAVSRRLDALK